MLGNTNKTYLNKLVILQKKIIRIIVGVKSRTHTEPLFKALNILNVFDINKFLIDRLMFHVYNENALEAFKMMFTQNKSIHIHDTRQSAHYNLPLVHKDVTNRFSIHYWGVVIWNEIMKCGIKTHESENTFLCDLKTMLLCNVLNCDWHVVLKFSYSRTPPPKQMAFELHLNFHLNKTMLSGGQWVNVQVVWKLKHVTWFRYQHTCQGCPGFLRYRIVSLLFLYNVFSLHHLHLLLISKFEPVIM